MTLERCITGALQIVAGAEVSIADSIVDAGSAANAAYAGDGAGEPGAELRATESTLVGTLHTRLLRLGSNSLFAGRAVAERRQEGCVRFSYVTPATARSGRAPSSSSGAGGARPGTSTPGPSTTRPRSAGRRREAS